jgi:hypothetical protein
MAKDYLTYCKEKSLEICNHFLEENSNEMLINKIETIIYNNM